MWRISCAFTAMLTEPNQVSLVELFKTRFGPEGLQSCEVMLRDIVDSRKINATLRPADISLFPTPREVRAAIPDDGISLIGLNNIFKGRITTSSATQEFLKIVREVSITDKAHQLLLPRLEYSVTEEPSRFSTLILSSFFWPSLREDEFDVPDPINAVRQSFEENFERIKNLRKLHWLSALGRVSIELELNDRTLNFDSVQTWQASVIYAFQDDSGGNQAAEKTIQELEKSLSMEELLVRNAVTFWVGQRVLIEVRKDTYQVLESLPSAEEEEAAVSVQGRVAQADAAISAIKSQDAVLRDNKEMYELFMIGMLTNGGAMDPSRVTMMMKLVVPGGYAFGEEETKWLLSDLVAQGKVAESGSNFAIKK